MGSNDLPTGSDPDSVGGGTPSAARICLLVDHDANRRMLEEWLEEDDDHEVVTALDGECDTVDLFLADGAGLRTGESLVAARKADAGAVFLPCLLASERGDVALGGIDETLVDDVVELPTGQAVLERRIRRLLVERDQSRQLDADRRIIEQQNDRLRMFAGRLAHDLRNPLGIASGYVEEARESGTVEHLEVVESALDRMRRLVDETLMLAKMGRTAIDGEEVSLRAVAGSAWTHVETADGTMTVTGDARLEADESRLEALFENLFRNAVEHGATGSHQAANAAENGSSNPRSRGSGEDGERGGGVAVRVGPLDDGSGFFVADDGCGISESDREQVFEVGHTTREDGTGFGLRIVQEIVEAHGWSVALTGSDEGGARFEVTGIALEPAGE